MQAGNRFFFTFEGGEGFLSEEESHHLVNVLRKKEKEKIKLINGKGEEYEGEIVQIIKKGKILRVKVRLLKLLRKENIPFKKIIALIPLLKGGKTEFLVEKGTELGIHEFIPFYSDFTVAKMSQNLKRRLEAKAINALKQSGRLYLPKINEPVNLKNFLAFNLFQNTFKIVGLPEKGISFKELIENITKSEKIVIVSGPEGGFSKEEEKILKEKKFVPLKLSQYILRAETASLSLMSFLNILFLNQDIS